MTNDLISTKALPGRPALQTPAMFDLVATLHNRLTPNARAIGRAMTGFSISDRCLPTEAERGALAERKRVLDRGLTAGDSGQMAETILEMFDAWPNLKMDRAKSGAVAATYLEPVVTLPAWAIVEASRACRGGDTPFPPSAGEFRAACMRAVDPYREERARIAHVLEADVVHETSDDERARMQAGWQALVADLGLNANPGGRPRDGRDAAAGRAEAQDRLEALAGQPVPGLSAEALATLPGRAAAREDAA